MDEAGALMAFSVRTSGVLPAPESFVPVALNRSVMRTVACQLLVGKLDDASVAWAKYCTAKVVVVLNVVLA